MNKTTYNPNTKIWSGPTVHPIYNTKLSLGQLILSVLRQSPSKITQVSVENEVKVSCYQMQKRMVQIAKKLDEMGFKKGDIVGVNATNSEYLAPTVFACFALGLPMNILASSFDKSDIVHMYSKTRPKLVFCDSNIFDVVNESLKEIGANSVMVTFCERVAGELFLEDFLVETGNEDDYW